MLTTRLVLALLVLIGVTVVIITYQPGITENNKQVKYARNHTKYEIYVSRKELHIKSVATVPVKTTSTPTKIEILEKVVDLQPVGLTVDGAMDTVNNAEDIAWYRYGAIPGANEGNALLAGHRDWKGKIGTLFYMDKMKKGDSITIYYKDGSKQRMVLHSIAVYPKDQVPLSVMENNGEARTTIITCSGPFNKTEKTYENRLVAVFTKV